MEADKAGMEFMLGSDLKRTGSPSEAVHAMSKSPVLLKNGVSPDVSVIPSQRLASPNACKPMSKRRSKSAQLCSSRTVNLKKRSGSIGNKVSMVKKTATKKKKFRRHMRPRDDLELLELTDQMDTYFTLYKRDPTQIFDAVDAVLHEEHQGNYLPSQREFFGRAKHKDARHSNMKTLTFKSVRGEYRIPLVLDSDCVRVDKDHAKLRDLYNQGIFNEDNDTDDSGREKGIERNFKHLQSALEQRKGSRRSFIRQYGLNKRSQLATITPASIYESSESERRKDSFRWEEQNIKIAHRPNGLDFKKGMEDGNPLTQGYMPGKFGLKKIKGQVEPNCGLSVASKMAQKSSTSTDKIKVVETIKEMELGAPECPSPASQEVQQRRDSNSMEEESPTKAEPIAGMRPEQRGEMCEEPRVLP